MPLGLSGQKFNKEKIINLSYFLLISDGSTQNPGAGGGGVHIKMTGVLAVPFRGQNL